MPQSMGFPATDRGHAALLVTFYVGQVAIEDQDCLGESVDGIREPLDDVQHFIALFLRLNQREPRAGFGHFDGRLDVGSHSDILVSEWSLKLLRQVMAEYWPFIHAGCLFSYGVMPIQ